MIIHEHDAISCIDFETTGAAGGNVPIELGIVRINGRGEILAHWESEFSAPTADGLAELSPAGPASATAPFVERWAEVRDWIDGTILCGHNVAFERNVLADHFPFFRAAEYVDTLQVFRRLYKGRIADFSLGELLRALDLYDDVAALALNEHFVPHRALFDAAACAILMRYLLTNPETRNAFAVPTQGTLF